MAELVKGFFIKDPNERAPEYVKKKVSVNVGQFTQWLKEHQNDRGYVNFDLLEAKSGQWYLKEDTWQPNNSGQSGSNNQQRPDSSSGSFEDDIPF